MPKRAALLLVALAAVSHASVCSECLVSTTTRKTSYVQDARASLEDWDPASTAPICGCAWDVGHVVTGEFGGPFISLLQACPTLKNLKQQISACDAVCQSLEDCTGVRVAGDGRDAVRCYIYDSAVLTTVPINSNRYATALKCQVTAPPSAAPSAAPSTLPSASPTTAPSASPTALPSASPTAAPSLAPTTRTPSVSPSTAPSRSPTLTGETYAPTTETPSVSPSRAPSVSPSIAPTTNSTGSNDSTEVLESYFRTKFFVVFFLGIALTYFCAIYYRRSLNAAEERQYRTRASSKAESVRDDPDNERAASFARKGSKASVRGGSRASSFSEPRSRSVSVASSSFDELAIVGSSPMRREATALSGGSGFDLGSSSDSTTRRRADTNPRPGTYAAMRRTSSSNGPDVRTLHEKGTSPRRAPRRVSVKDMASNINSATALQPRQGRPPAGSITGRSPPLPETRKRGGSTATRPRVESTNSASKIAVGDWESITDHAKGRTYFVNRVTGEFDCDEESSLK